VHREDVVGVREVPGGGASGREVEAAGEERGAHGAVEEEGSGEREAAEERVHGEGSAR
jgi:hypothetical protein